MTRLLADTKRRNHNENSVFSLEAAIEDEINKYSLKDVPRKKFEDDRMGAYRFAKD